MTAVRTGRRRWGQTSFKSVDSWEDGEDADAGVSISKKPTISSLKDQTLDGPKNVGAKNKTAPKLQSNTGLNRADSNTFSAKQHYLRQSRYLPGETKSPTAASQNTFYPGILSSCRAFSPGINPKSRSSVEGQVTGRNLWGNSGLTRGQGLEFPPTEGQKQVIPDNISLTKTDH